MSDKNGAALDPKSQRAECKELLAMRAIEDYTSSTDVMGHVKAAEEMGHLLGQYVLRGDLNQFEADMIATVAILGNVATNVINQNDRLRHE